MDDDTLLLFSGNNVLVWGQIFILYINLAFFFQWGKCLFHRSKRSMSDTVSRSERTKSNSFRCDLTESDTGISDIHPRSLTS